MKAVVCSEFGGPEALKIETLEEPPLGKSEVRIEVHACGVNFPDVLMVHGKHRRLQMALFMYIQIVINV